MYNWKDEIMSKVNPDQAPALIPNRMTDENRTLNALAYLDHAHELETGKCIKNRFGPPCNVDPFLMIQGETPNSNQQALIEAIVPMVRIWLEPWGKATGKTKARLFLAQAIIEGDK